MRLSGRKDDQLRNVLLEINCNPYAEGSCFSKFGNTHVLCTATVEEKVPPFLRNTGKGWITAEYGMLPRSTHSRMEREAAKGKQGGRTQEIQRLIGRSLRAVVNLEKLGERQIRIDCDVIQADGGTRTAAITGSYVALALAIQKLLDQKLLPETPLMSHVVALSCGLVKGRPVLDLDYDEDSSADADINFVLAGDGEIVEIQGTAETQPFSEKSFHKLFALAQKGAAELIELQKAALGLS